MEKFRILYGLFGLTMIAFASCSQSDWEQERTGAGKEETFTRADLIEYTINVETAGTLDSLVQTGSYSDAQKLIITGDIAYEDVNYVDVNMATVEILDLSESTYESESISGAFLSDSTKIKEISLPGNITSISGERSEWWNTVSPFKNTHLTKITLPESMTSIEKYAFYQCSYLTNINIPESVTSIGYYSFYGCSSLTDIKIPEGVRWINGGAFSGCSSLTNITIPESVTSILDYAFYNCSSLTNITLPENLTSIGKYAFENCSSLTSINIPNGVTTINYETFQGCSSLSSITLPKGLTSIGDFAFRNCTSLTSIDIPEGVTSIGRQTFMSCPFTSVHIPESVTDIGSGAFNYCHALTNIDLPESITSIKSGVFLVCSSLTSISIPKSVTSIGNDAFAYCSSLTSITIPESVTSIGERAFSGCNSLTITIPESVTSIGNYALAGKKVICNSSINDVGDISSSSSSSWLIINRPDGNIPMYGPNWKNVVINGVAEDVSLIYHNDMDFTIPEEVQFIKKISYTMTFGTNNSSSSYGIWKTIALPFKPTHITHVEKGELAPFDSDVEGAKNFWLRELTTEGFKDVTQIEPNHPYLIAMPYSKEYDDRYNISGEVTFSAEDLTPEDFANTTPLSAEGMDYTMYASYSYMKSKDGVYVLNSSNQFTDNFYSLYPFEAYLKANTATLRSVISLNKGRAATRAGSKGKRKPQIDDM